MPSGTVNVFDDGYFVGSVDVNFGMGSMTFFLLDAGSHSLTASFLAHDTYDGSTGELTLVVNKADSTTTVSTACMTKFVEFQPFTVSATVRPGMFCCCITGVTAALTNACNCASSGTAAKQEFAPKSRPKAAQEMTLLD